MSKDETQQKPWADTLKTLPADQAKFADTFATTFRDTFVSSFSELMPSLMKDAFRNLG